METQYWVALIIAVGGLTLGKLVRNWNFSAAEAAAADVTLQIVTEVTEAGDYLTIKVTNQTRHPISFQEFGLVLLNQRLAMYPTSLNTLPFSLAGDGASQTLLLDVGLLKVFDGLADVPIPSQIYLTSTTGKGYSTKLDRELGKLMVRCSGLEASRSRASTIRPQTLNS